MCLLGALRKKLEEKRGKRRAGSTDFSDTDEPRLTRRPYGNKNAAKQVRTIEIGWIHKSDRIATSTFMKKNKGGGTRKFKISKEATKKDQFVSRKVHLWSVRKVNFKVFIRLCGFAG